MLLPDHIHTIDTHTAGGPTRIVTSGIPFLKGSTIRDKMEYFKKHLDHYRKMLMLEPRGHSGMFGAVLTQPCRTEADLGVFFMTSTGYLNMCVHSAMGVVAAGLSCGMVDNKNDKVILDTPSGLIEIKKGHKKGRQSLILSSDPAFVYAKDVVITIPHIGRIIVDIVFSGVYFVLFDIGQSEHSLHLDLLNELALLGKELIREINHSIVITSPVTGENQKVALAILYKNNTKNEGINAVISSTGSLDRSPCGAGTGARLALLCNKNQLNLEEIYTNISLINTRFTGFLSNMKKEKEFVFVTPNIIGESYITGFQHFISDQKDTLNPFLI